MRLSPRYASRPCSRTTRASESVASSDGDVVFPTEEPRNQAVSGPRIHCTSHRSEQIPGPSESQLRACQPAKVPVKVEFVSSPLPGSKSPVCLSHLVLRCAGPVSLVSLLCTTAPTPHGQPYRRSDLECYMRAVDIKASPGQCLLALATSLSRWTVVTLSTTNYLQAAAPPPLSIVII